MVRVVEVVETKYPPGDKVSTAPTGMIKNDNFSIECDKNGENLIDMFLNSYCYTV